MRHLEEHQPTDRLQTALNAVRDDDARALPRPQLGERVMRDWDTRRRSRRRSLAIFWFAAAASVALVLTWSSAQNRHDQGKDDAVAERPMATPPGTDTLLAPDVLMDDASSFQYVQLRLAPRTMAALGIPVANPADDEPIAVEALIGLDGIPRSIRYAQFKQESQ